MENEFDSVEIVNGEILVFEEERLFIVLLKIWLTLLRPMVFNLRILHQIVAHSLFIKSSTVVSSVYLVTVCYVVIVTYTFDYESRVFTDFAVNGRLFEAKLKLSFDLQSL